MSTPRPGATRRYDLVVFDWDGTLADSTSIIAEALQRACADIGCPVPDETTARFVIGLGLADAVRHIAPGLATEQYPLLSARYRHHYFARENEIPLYPGARELIAGLRTTGHHLAVATGKSRVGLDRALDFHALREVFAATRCADEGRPKPHPEMLHHLMACLDVPPPRVLMIGDTTHDLEMAAQAGVDSLGIAHGAHDEAVLGIATRGVCHSLQEVARIVAA